MYDIQLTNYTPEPTPVSTDRIIAAHYYAAWKKGAPGIHNGFDDLHDYPERTPLMGYYDEENPAVCDWEIKWAVEHGINCFIHCWYRKLDNMGKLVTVNDLRCGHGLHEALFHAKYQKFMKFAIMFENSPRWGTTDAVDAVEHGFEGMLFGLCNGSTDEQVYEENIARGYDFRFGYDSGYIPEKDFPDEEEVINGQCERFKQYLRLDPMKHIATASCFRDATPRTTEHWISMGYKFHKEKKWRLSPEKFRLVLRGMKEAADKLPDGAWAKRIMMIDNWNEWDEGHYVSPSHEFGFKYLQAIREELTMRDNLPDYRTPQDLGLDGYNTSWEIPGFKQICERKLHEYN